MSDIWTRGYTLTWIASLLYNLGFQAATATLPLYAIHLSASETEVGLLTGLFALTALLGRPLVGWQLDRGRKRLMLVVGTAVFVLSSVGYALVTTVPLLLMLRLVNGVGHAAGFTSSQTLANDHAPPPRLGTALGFHGATLTLAIGLGGALGTPVALRYGFTSLYWVAAGLSLMAGLVALMIPAPAPANSISTQQREWAFNPAVIRPGFGLGAVLCAFGVMVALGPVHAARQGMVNPGLLLLVFAIGMVLAQALGGPLVDGKQRGSAIQLGLTLLLIGLLGVAWLQGAWLFLTGAIVGAGIGLSQMGLLAVAVNQVPASQRGSALATAGMFIELGIVTGATGGGMIGELAGLPLAFLALSAPAALMLIGQGSSSVCLALQQRRKGAERQ